MRPRRWQARPTLQPSTAPGASSGSAGPVDIDIQPVFLRSSWDFIGTEPWVHIPTPILAIVQEEGVDFPFYTRTTQDERWGREPYRRKKLRAHLHPQVQGVSLALLSPPDETLLALIREEYEGPSARDRFKRRKKRQHITAQLPSDYDSSRFAFLPATAYADSTCRMYSEIQRHFLENIIDEGLSWSLWTTEEVVRAYKLRLTRFLLETEILRERRTLTLNAGQTDYDLPSDTISVCRAAVVVGGVESVLSRVDEWALDNGSVGWETTSGTPYAYIEDSATGTLRITVVPAPSANGTINLIIVPDPFNPQAVTEHCVPIPIPAIFSVYVKWGVIADLLAKEGEANDPSRAAYAESRYKEGIELANLYTSAEGR